MVTRKLKGAVTFINSTLRWTRLLIEDVTGYYSGSVYIDDKLYNGGFIGENEIPTNGKTIVVKNHNVKLLKSAKGIILLIRNPYDAILAEFNRQKSHGAGSHTGSVDHALFNTTKWFTSIDKLAKRWARWQMQWFWLLSDLWHWVDR